ncbi:hypothetical protein D3C78_931320 [compost metagenome]
MSSRRPLRYKCINPHCSEVEDFAQLFIDSWEVPILKQGLKVVNTATGEVLKHQYVHANRGWMAVVPLRLKAKEQRILEILPIERTEPPSSISCISCDRIDDIKWPQEVSLHPSPIVLSGNCLETQYVRIEWKPGKGIISWIDKDDGHELIRTDAEHPAFTPVYEITHSLSPEAQAETRRVMGRNRKGVHVRRFAGELIQVKPLIKGPVLTCVELIYQVQGMKFYSVLLTVYASVRRVDVSFRIQKDCIWDAENVYISLPFADQASESNEIWLDKGLRLMRPWKDQIMGTGTDFYTVQKGVVINGGRKNVIIAMPDTPLVQVGSLEYEERRLSGHPDLLLRTQNLYTWLMSNYWETNFKASLEGFYEFKYTVAWGSEWGGFEHAFAKCSEMEMGIVSFRTGGEGKTQSREMAGEEESSYADC